MIQRNIVLDFGAIANSHTKINVDVLTKIAVLTKNHMVTHMTVMPDLGAFTNFDIIFNQG